MNVSKEQYKEILCELRRQGYNNASLIVYTRIEIEHEVSFKDRDEDKRAYHVRAHEYLYNARNAIEALNEILTEDELSEADPEPITILDYVRSKVGEKDTYSADDHSRNGVDIMGGCYRCHATLGSYNAYPSKNGYWSCRTCLEDGGFTSIEEFEQWQLVQCREWATGVRDEHDD